MTEASPSRALKAAGYSGQHRSIKPNETKAITKVITIKIFSGGNDRFKTYRLHSPAGKGYTEKGIDDCLEHFADQLEVKSPRHDYRMVQVGPFAYNFIWAGYKSA